jgi:cysteine desulfurase
MNTVYFDNNATTRVLPQVVEAMLPWFSEQYGNASSSNQLGQRAKEALIAARSAVAGFINASLAEIVFTSGATEANHMAILGALAASPARRRIVTSTVEHTSTLRLLDHLASTGVEVVKVPVHGDGTLDMTALTAAVNEDTALVTLMHANNETGVLFPIAEAAAIAHAQGAAFHTDAAQTAGKIALDVRQLGCDLMSFSGHKLHAAKGVGVLFVRKGFTLQPLIYGHQERNRRGGTENQAGIVGLGLACQLAQTHITWHGEQISALRDRLQQGILARVKFASANSSAAHVPNTSNICFPGIHGEELLYRLDQAGIVASQGSACTAGGTEPSHVLLAMGLSRDNALSSLRFSLSRETTESEVDFAIETIANVVAGMMAAQAVAA